MMAGEVTQQLQILSVFLEDSVSSIQSGLLTATLSSSSRAYDVFSSFEATHLYATYRDTYR